MDVVCVDKTGTLTEECLRVASVSVVYAGARRPPTSRRAQRVPSWTNAELPRSRPIAGHLEDPSWAAADWSFCSARKWSGATFDGQGTMGTGRPDIVPRQGRSVPGRRVSDAGNRVVLLARSSGLVEDGVPERRRWRCSRSRSGSVEAAPTSPTLTEGVTVKVISGDHPDRRRRRWCGWPCRVGRGRRPHLRADPDALADALDRETTVFGRVQLRQAGDGRGPLGHGHVFRDDRRRCERRPRSRKPTWVAMGSGSPASRAVARRAARRLPRPWRSC